MGRYMEYLAREWSVADIPFDRVRILAPSETSIEGPLSERIEVVATGGPRRPLVLWEQLTLPRASAGAALLFCPSYTAPIGRRGPLVVANHGIYERFPQEFSRARRLRAIPVYRAAVRRADAVIANSRSTSADLVEFLGADPARIEVVYAGPGPQFREPPDPEAVDAAVRRALGERAPYVMFAGKLSPRRNLPALIEAFAAARRADGLPHRLLVVGPQGDAGSVNEQAARLGVTDALVHLHHLELGELQLLYAGAEVFALPTTYEGYSWTILEAMASGAPVLTADHPALHEEGVANAAEVVAEPTPAALEAALRRLLADPDLRRRRSEAGRAVAARFSWRRTAAETMAVLDRVAAPADRRG